MHKSISQKSIGICTTRTGHKKMLAAIIICFKVLIRLAPVFLICIVFELLTKNYLKFYLPSF